SRSFGGHREFFHVITVFNQTGMPLTVQACQVLAAIDSISLIQHEIIVNTEITIEPNNSNEIQCIVEYVTELSQICYRTVENQFEFSIPSNNPNLIHRKWLQVPLSNHNLDKIIVALLFDGNL